MFVDSHDHSYNATQHATWRHFFAEIEQVWAAHEDLIHPFYLDHIQVLNRFRERVPALSEINQLLSAIGWRAAYVDGLAPPWEIARLLDDRVMPMSRQIRSPQEVFFANGPDLIHDIFGHLPSLMDRDYRALLASWSAPASRVEIAEIDKVNYHLNKLIVQSQDNVEQAALHQLKIAAEGMDQFIAKHPSPALMFDKTYFWIFEFGLVEVQGALKILGAGLLSSLSETRKIATGDVAISKLDMASILSPYNISSLQDGYLVASDLQHFRRLIAEMNDLVPTGADDAQRHYAHA